MMPRSARALFSLLSLLALGYVVWAGYGQWTAISLWRPGPAMLAVLVAVGLMHGVIYFLLAETWHRAVLAGTAARLERRDSYRAYCATQIAKYLPGNVLHLAGRHVLQRRGDITHKGLAAALALEILLLVLAASTIAALGLALAAVSGSGIRLPGRLAGWAVFGLPVALLVAGWLAGTLARRNGLEPALLWRHAGIAYLAAIGFFALQGLIFFVIGSGIAPVPLLVALTAVSLAWIAGFITPGLPGGLGVREAILLVLLSPHMAEADALIAIALFRLVAISGDALLYLFGRVLFGSVPPDIGKNEG